MLAVLKSLQDFAKNGKPATAVIKHAKPNTAARGLTRLWTVQVETASTFDYPHPDKQQERAFWRYFATAQPRCEACSTKSVGRCGSTQAAGQVRSIRRPSAAVSGCASRPLPSCVSGQSPCAHRSPTHLGFPCKENPQAGGRGATDTRLSPQGTRTQAGSRDACPPAQKPGNTPAGRPPGRERLRLRV